MQLHGFMNAIESMVMICRLSEFLITLNFNLVKDNITELKLMSLMLIWYVVICCTVLYSVLFAKHSKQQTANNNNLSGLIGLSISLMVGVLIQPTSFFLFDVIWVNVVWCIIFSQWSYMTDHACPMPGIWDGRQRLVQLGWDHMESSNTRFVWKQCKAK